MGMEMTEIEQLATLAAQTREKRKTQLSEQELRFATELATTTLRKEAVDVIALLDALDSLPVRVVSEVVGEVWGDLTAERKSLLARWITRKEGDRAPKRIVQCASQILPFDALTTIDFLARVLPREDSLSQELRGDLRRSFASKRAPDLTLLADDKLNQEVIGRFCRCMLASLDAEVQFAKRQQLARLSTQLLDRLSNGDPTAISLSAALEKEVRSWPQSARAHFENRMPPNQLSPGKTAITAVGPLPENVEKCATRGPAEISDREWVSERTKQLQFELSVLARIESAFCSEENIDRLEKRIEAMQHELELKAAELESQQHLQRELQATFSLMERESAEARAVLVQRDAELRECRSEIARLVSQISATSVTAVSEVKQRLGATLRKLTADLPERTTELECEQLRFIFRQYHQFIDKLEEHGINVRAQGTATEWPTSV